jgi:flagellar basal body-associated protein FliL
MIGEPMTESNQISEIRNQKSPIIRMLLIVLVAAAVLAIGHYGFRAFREAADAEAPGPTQFGR